MAVVNATKNIGSNEKRKKNVAFQITLQERTFVNGVSFQHLKPPVYAQSYKLRCNRSKAKSMFKSCIFVCHLKMVQKQAHRNNTIELNTQSMFAIRKMVRKI